LRQAWVEAREADSAWSPHQAGDVAEIVELAKIVRLVMYVAMGDTKSVREE
jgi:hypothetical protein